MLSSTAFFAASDIVGSMMRLVPLSISRAALKSTAGAAEDFRTFLAFKNGGDEKSALVADAEKRLAQ